MEVESEEEWEEASQHPPASPNCGHDSNNQDLRPHTTARVTSREASREKLASREASREKLTSRDFELGSQTIEEEYLESAREEMMECFPDSPLPRGQVTITTKLKYK